MNTYKTHILLALCLAMSGAGSLKIQGQVASKEASAAFEKTRIKAGLDKAGVGTGYEIVVADERDLVENTAAEVLQRFLAKASLSVGITPESKANAGKRIILGRDSNLKAIGDLEDQGKISIRNVPAEDDGFHLKRIGGDIVIAGANPRGVLYGVYAFEDFINAGADGDLDVRKIPYFRKRASGPEYSFNRYSDLSTEDFPEEKAAYLSRMGVNQLTDQGIGGLDSLVMSDVFPFQKPPSPDRQRRVRVMSALCKKYGIDQYLWIHAPEIAGDLDKYPEGTIGPVKRPWGGDKDGMGKALCVSSPLVQEHYRNMMRKLVREYPDVKGVLFYNLDGNSFLCTPALCERCKTVCHDSSPDLFNPWETQARLVTLLAETLQAEKPGFDFRFWAAVHYHDKHFEKMIGATRGFNSLTASWTGSDRSIMVPAAAEIASSFTFSQKIARERGIPFHMLCELNNLEQVPKSFPFPFHVIDSLKKFKQWGVRNLTEIYGMVPEHNQINSLVMKEFQWNPDRNPEEFLADLSRRQFGKQAGEKAYQAWREIEKAFDVWDDIPSGIFPLAGSQFNLSLGTSIGGLPPPILPEIVKYYGNLLQILTKVEPWFENDYQKYKSPAFLDKMNRMNVHLARAAEHARQAVVAASDREYIGVGYYEGVNGCPTRKEYAELNHASIAIAESMCRQRYDIIRAYLLLTGIESARGAGDEKSARAKENLYHELVREDIGVQEHFCALLEGFAQMQPCYTRTSLADHEIADQLSRTRDKIEKLKAYLATKKM